MRVICKTIDQPVDVLVEHGDEAVTRSTVEANCLLTRRGQHEAVVGLDGEYGVSSSIPPSVASKKSQ